MLALNIVSKIATGMGSAFDKHTRLLVAPVASVCADQKTSTRAAGIATLTAMAEASGSLESLYPGIGASLDTPNPALRASVLNWLFERFEADPPGVGTDMTPLAGPVISCLEDRNGDVRKGATLILPMVVQHAGYDFVMDQTSKLKPASKATIVPLINAAKGSTKAPAPRPKVTAATTRAPDSPKLAAPARSIVAPARSLAMKALAPSTRPVTEDRPSALPKARALVRPASAASRATTASSSTSRPTPFITTATEARTGRLKRDTTRWILDPVQSKDLSDYLSAQMEPHVLPEIFAQLFSKDHRAEEDYIAALTAFAEFFDRTASTSFGLGEDEIQVLQVANVDLAVKYAALRLLSNNTQVANRCFELVAKVIENMQAENDRFSDAEARLFVPALIMKVRRWRDDSNVSWATRNSDPSLVPSLTLSTRSLLPRKSCNCSLHSAWRISPRARRAKMNRSP